MAAYDRPTPHDREAGDFAEEYRFEVQLAVMAGVQLRTDELQAYPLVAARLYLLQSEKLGLYLGSAFAVLVETTALIWGLAYRF